MSLSLDPQLLTGLGAALSIFLTASGSAIASAEAGYYCLHRKGYSAFVPIVISGVLAIYGIIVSIILISRLDGSIINGGSNDGEEALLSSADGYRNLSAGLSVGLACLASGLGIAKFLGKCNSNSTTTITTSSSGSNNTSESEPLLPREQNNGSTENTLHMFLVLVFLEAIGLYGLIVALLLAGKKN